jgi:hypothetical protein
MVWTIDKKGLTIAASWKPKDKEGKITVYQAKWNEFMDQLRKGKHPVEAAKAVGDSKYTVLNKKTGQAEFRVGGKDRVTFIVDDENHVLSRVCLGGHT